MKNTFIVLFLLFSVIDIFAEVSAFGAGDLKSKNPYGLSESEKVIYSNKKATIENNKKIKALNLKIEQLSESIEGLRSVVDSLNDKVGQTGQKVSLLTQKRSSDDEIESLKAKVEEQNEKYNNLALALKKLTLMIDELSSQKQRSKKSASKSTKHTSISNAQLLKKAIRTFRNKQYKKAFDMFETLDIKNYKRATANFYMGECAYYLKKYEDAIIYFKKSAGLYDKASYMPTLMLHTALSFKKSGDSENAERFLNAVIDTYPGTSQAKIAKKNL